MWRKMEKSRLYSVLLIFLILFVSNGNIMAVSAEYIPIEMNFEVWLYVQAGSRNLESYALYTKQALVPLGIEVKIFAKTNGQFVGDLLHTSTGHPFDIIFSSFSDNSPVPSFITQYHSDPSTFGDKIYQLNTPEFQEWQVNDTMITTKYVDALLEEIEFEMDLENRKDLITEFNDLFFTNLLYDIPIVSKTPLTSMWKGFGGEYNELWDPNEGVVRSRMLGANWTEFTSAERESDNNTISLRINTPVEENMFDPYQSFDESTGLITEIMHDGLLYFDKNYDAHPGIAWNWYFNKTDILYDHDNFTDTPEIAIYEYVWFLGNQSYWSATTDIIGNPIEREIVDGNDFVMALDMLRHPMTNTNSIGGLNAIVNYFSNTTLNPNDTFTIRIRGDRLSPNDYYNFGSIKPIPHHILGGDLLINETSMAKVTDFVNWNPQLSEEWMHWSSYVGHSLVGPYELLEYDNEYSYIYEARADYYYPNEMDSNLYYENTEFLSLENKYGWNFTIFGPHINNMTAEPHYWNWGNPKPSSQGIETIQYSIINDINAALLSFEAGNIDFFESSDLGAQIVENHQNNPKFVIKDHISETGPELLVFNLLHDDLKKFNVRLAIAHVLDKDEFVNIHDGFAKPHHSIVWPRDDWWYVPHYIEYDYDKSRDLMRSEGYHALQNEYTYEVPPPPPPPGPPHPHNWLPDSTMLLLFTYSLILTVAGIVYYKTKTAY